MTKKSAARLARDEAKKELDQFKKEARPWDDLMEIYVANKEMLYEVPAQILYLFSVEKIGNFMENPKLTADLIRCMQADIDQMKQELEEIAAGHKHKTGKAVDDDDFIQSLTFIEAYNSFKVKFEGVILPNVQTITQHYDAAVAKVQEIVQAEQAKESITDPNVISDAVIIENPTKTEEVAQTNVEITNTIAESQTNE